MASFFQINTASTLGSGPLPSNTVANSKEEDEREDETLTNQDLAEYTIKVPHPLVQKPKPPSQRNFVVHQRDPLHLNIPYPSRMHKQKQQEKHEVQIHKFWQMFNQLHINITIADALILILKYQKILKALLSNKEKLLELENTPLNENCSAVILKKLPEKLRDPRKFLISCGFSELKCKGLADLEFNSESADLLVKTVKRYSRQTKLPTSLNNFIIDGKIKYGVERVVNCANISS
nr:reverse transcriptase domain-containing protein [Tanacetum cinerariifolium]